jgi:murein DD-endopeptidase MepM/ murein hydrolase activator NlpD
VCAHVLSPFQDPDRASLPTLRKRFGSGFGDARTSYVKGHKHAGLDIKTSYGEAVYAVCPGVVADIHLGYPHRTVVVRHQMPDGATRWTSYKHVEDVGVAVGDAVDTDTRIGRVFTKAEQAGAGWKLNHLHFEVRTSIADGGAASWTSMSQAELERFATDPLPFFEAGMR